MLPTCTQFTVFFCNYREKVVEIICKISPFGLNIFKPPSDLLQVSSLFNLRKLISMEAHVMYFFTLLGIQSLHGFNYSHTPKSTLEFGISILNMPSFIYAGYKESVAPERSYISPQTRHFAYQTYNYYQNTTPSKLCSVFSEVSSPTQGKSGKRTYATSSWFASISVLQPFRPDCYYYHLYYPCTGSAPGYHVEYRLVLITERHAERL